MKNITGQCYELFLSNNKLKCQSVVSAQRLKRRTWQEDLCTYFRSRSVAWRYFYQSYCDHTLHSKELYLNRCSYYVLDPHMDVNGIRRKIMRVIPPKHDYERAGVSRNEMSPENDVESVGDLAEESWGMKLNGTKRWNHRQIPHNVGSITNRSCYSSFVINRSLETPLDTSLIIDIVCLNVSVFDVQWGQITITDSSIVFTTTPKPESIKGELKLKNTHK